MKIIESLVYEHYLLRSESRMLRMQLHFAADAKEVEKINKRLKEVKTELIKLKERFTLIAIMQN